MSDNVNQPKHYACHEIQPIDFINANRLDYLEELQASDRRLKNNITKVGKSLSGINVYTFNYNNSDRYGDSLYQGVMSDEVPSNVVVVGKDGYDLVDYSKLDVEFKRVLI